VLQLFHSLCSDVTETGSFVSFICSIITGCRFNSPHSCRVSSESNNVYLISSTDLSILFRFDGSRTSARIFQIVKSPYFCTSFRMLSHLYKIYRATSQRIAIFSTVVIYRGNRVSIQLPPGIGTSRAAASTGSRSGRVTYRREAAQLESRGAPAQARTLGRAQRCHCNQASCHKKRCVEKRRSPVQELR
jgi:hypothetical protein